MGLFGLIFPVETAAELRWKVKSKTSLGAVIRESAVEELIDTLSMAAVSVEFRQFVHVGVPDPKDVYLLDAAMSGRADFLITGDKPLQQMTSPPTGTSIVAPAEFLMILETLRGESWESTK